MNGMRQTAGENMVLAAVNNLSTEVLNIREKCLSIRHLLDEATYKMEASLNVINGLKKQEENILKSAGNPVAVKQLTEEQIDGFLEMLKTPAFQNLVKQVLTKWVVQESPK